MPRILIITEFFVNTNVKKEVNTMRTKLNITEGIFPMPVLMIATYNEDGTVKRDLPDARINDRDLQ